MERPARDPQPDHTKEKIPQTRPAPPDKTPEFIRWAEKQPKAKEGDKGQLPPDPPQDQKEPREHGSREREG
jgi:hypothetical protein